MFSAGMTISRDVLHRVSAASASAGAVYRKYMCSPHPEGYDEDAENVYDAPLPSQQRFAMLRADSKGGARPPVGLISTILLLLVSVEPVTGSQ